MVVLWLLLSRCIFSIIDREARLPASYACITFIISIDLQDREEAHNPKRTLLVPVHNFPVIFRAIYGSGHSSWFGSDEVDPARPVIFEDLLTRSDQTRESF